MCLRMRENAPIFQKVASYLDTAEHTMSTTLDINDLNTVS